MRSSNRGCFTPSKRCRGVTIVRHRGGANGVKINVVGSCKVHNKTVTSDISRSSRGVVMMKSGSHSVTVTMGRVVQARNNCALMYGKRVCKALPLPIVKLVDSTNCRDMGRTLTGVVPGTRRVKIGRKFSPFVALSFVTLPIVPRVEVAPEKVCLMGRSEVLEAPFDWNK